jgi:hypothetical protein
MTCTTCAKSRQTKPDRVPAGWKRTEDGIFCRDCWLARFAVRAISLPIVEILDGTWNDFRAALRIAWGDTTQAANWMMTELFARDVRRGDEPKMPAMARQYLYPDARARFPRLPSQSVAALEQAVQKKYRAFRYDVIWTCRRSLPSHRYPQPLPVPNQGWSIEICDDCPVLSLPLGDSRWRVRLKGGPRYRRQAAAIGQLITGAAVQGQLDIYQQTIDGKSAVMAKMVGWFPRAAKRDVSGDLRVRTARDSMIVAGDLVYSAPVAR